MPNQRCELRHSVLIRVYQDYQIAFETRWISGEGWDRIVESDPLPTPMTAWAHYQCLLVEEWLLPDQLGNGQQVKSLRVNEGCSAFPSQRWAERFMADHAEVLEGLRAYVAKSYSSRQTGELANAIVRVGRLVKASPASRAAGRSDYRYVIILSIDQPPDDTPAATG